MKSTQDAARALELEGKRQSLHRQMTRFRQGTSFSVTAHITTVNARGGEGPYSEERIAISREHAAKLLSIIEADVAQRISKAETEMRALGFEPGELEEKP
jgi:hypothetical protein